MTYCFVKRFFVFGNCCRLLAIFAIYTQATSYCQLGIVWFCGFLDTVGYSILSSFSKPLHTRRIFKKSVLPSKRQKKSWELFLGTYRCYSFRTNPLLLFGKRCIRSTFHPNFASLKHKDTTPNVLTTFRRLSNTSFKPMIHSKLLNKRIRIIRIRRRRRVPEPSFQAAAEAVIAHGNAVEDVKSFRSLGALLSKRRRSQFDIEMSDASQVIWDIDRNNHERSQMCP